MYSPSARVSLLLTLALFFGIIAISLPARADDSYNAIERALGVLDSGEIDSARTALETMHDAGKAEPLLHCAQGTVELYAKNYLAAEAMYRRVLIENPRHVPSLCGLGLCMIERHQFTDAAIYLDRAAEVAPTDTQIKTLQAYDLLQRGQCSEAATAGKTALEGGDRSPFLMAVLAEVYRRMGNSQKAVEFGGYAARSYSNMDFLTIDQRVSLPLLMPGANGATVTSHSATSSTPLLPPPAQWTNLELPAAAKNAHDATERLLHLSSPATGSTMNGVQHIQAEYSGVRAISFLAFLVDGTICGLASDYPYHFQWDADTVAPGAHKLCVRAYDDHGQPMLEDTITVTVAGATPAAPDVAASEWDIDQRLITLMMPTPSPFSLFWQLGNWHRELGDRTQAIACYEKAAAIDPSADNVLGTLASLYHESGLHPLSPSGQIYRGPEGGLKRVALTFDDGPNPLYTPSILAELKKYNAHSTFFMVGKMVQQYPKLAQDILANGNELANHTYTHPNMTKLNQQEIIAEALRGRSVIRDVTGQQTYLFRPPGGNIDPFVTSQLRALDYNIVYWDIIAGSFQHYGAKQADKIVSLVHDGSIVLLHDGPIDGTLAILPRILSELYRQGYTCVTVSELLKD